MSDQASSDGSAAVPTQAQLKTRLRRLEILRGASRALTPSISGQPTTAPFDGAELAKSLTQLARRVTALEESADPASVGEQRAIASALEEIDEQLVAARNQLLGVMDGIPLVQLRASLPGIALQRRFDVLSLLDLLLQDQKGVFDRAVLFDYLVTLLATEERDGRRWVAHDPVGLVPRLRLICQKIDALHGDRAQELEQEFFAAASAQEGNDRLEAVLARMRKRKQSLGQRLFVPAVLRAVVTYNTAIANKIEDQLHESKRESDEEMVGLAAVVGAEDELDLLRGALGVEVPAEPDGDVSDPGSIFESPVVVSIAKALRLRGEGTSLGTSAPERIAARLDLAEVAAADLAHVATIEGRAGDRVMGLTVLLGLLNRAAEESTLDLRELGILPDHLRENWAIELDQALKDRGNELIAGNDYEQACALGELKTRFLYESITSVNRVKRRARPRSVASPALVDNAELRALAEGARASAAAMPVGPDGSRRGQRSLRGRRVALLGGFAAVLSTLALVSFVSTNSTSVHYMDSVELGAISEHLASGYRNEAGTLFVGNLNDSWKALSEEEQQRAAEELMWVLAGVGVREVMAFDSDRRLCVQGAGGKLRLPRARTSAPARAASDSPATRSTSQRS